MITNFVISHLCELYDYCVCTAYVCVCMCVYVYTRIFVKQAYDDQFCDIAPV
jgi:hypothetical protein